MAEEGLEEGVRSLQPGPRRHSRQILAIRDLGRISEGCQLKGLDLGPWGGSSTFVPEELRLRPHESMLVTADKERIPIPAAVLGREG